MTDQEQYATDQGFNDGINGLRSRYYSDGEEYYEYTNGQWEGIYSSPIVKAYLVGYTSGVQSSAEGAP